MKGLIYFIVAFVSTVVGAFTGMGGGVIIKPLCDFINGYNTQTIGVLSSITVFSMAVVSVYRQVKMKTKIELDLVLPISFGSVAGGILGQELFKQFVRFVKANNIVLIMQNLLLAVIIAVIYIYMKKKNLVKPLGVSGIIPAFLAGMFLGTLSSFLGIGGGPINVALIIYLFSYSTKSAVVCSIFTILFSQVSKLLTIALTTGFSVYDLDVLPFMVVGAVLGGTIGSDLNKKLSEDVVEKVFNMVQVFVCVLALVNVVKNIS